MKVILNEDIKHLGEYGDVKIVANGYARNYLFPRNLAVPYYDATVAYFESKKEEIEARKAAKRNDAASLKEKLDAHEIVVVMPAGQNGKLYGAVTTQTIADALAKDGFDIERKKIEINGAAIKSVGKFKATVHLYETASAEIIIEVKPQEDKKPEEAAKKAEEKAAETPVAEAPAEEAAPAEEKAE
ncbi:MAG: 50S ribosomal protein L9 [Treponema sp.]|nr:50S ribosomal protein L9 [Candidatus Treponema caballi]